MSFSNDVRQEVCAYISDKDKRYACLYGMLLFCRKLTDGHICFQTGSSTSANKFCELFKEIIGCEISMKQQERKSGKTMYTYETKDTELIAKVFEKYRISSADERKIDSEIISNNSLGVFTAGVFLSCGSVNDPEKKYHLEFAANDENLAVQLKELLGNIGVNAKTVPRRSQHIVYIKDSESIEDTLTFIGAQQATLELINVKILKDMRNRVNRSINCDNANIDKMVKAAEKQLADIMLIVETDGLDSLSPELREVAELRLEDGMMSLKEIGESIEVPISRSGVNHRFQKISEIAEEIRNRSKKNESC